MPVLLLGLVALVVALWALNVISKADPKTGAPTRVRFEERDGKKVRVAAKSGELIHG